MNFHRRDMNLQIWRSKIRTGLLTWPITDRIQETQTKSDFYIVNMFIAFVAALVVATGKSVVIFLSNFKLLPVIWKYGLLNIFIYLVCLLLIYVYKSVSFDSWCIRLCEIFVCIMYNSSIVPWTIDYTCYAVSGKVECS